jgi:hypothetical protein
MFGLTQIQAIVIGGALAVVLVGGAITYVYNKGERAGSADVKAAVQSETIKATEGARISKEKTDVEVIRTPYDDRADGLR